MSLSGIPGKPIDALCVNMVGFIIEFVGYQVYTSIHGNPIKRVAISIKWMRYTNGISIHT